MQSTNPDLLEIKFHHGMTGEEFCRWSLTNEHDIQTFEDLVAEVQPRIKFSTILHQENFKKLVPDEIYAYMTEMLVNLEENSVPYIVFSIIVSHTILRLVKEPLPHILINSTSLNLREMPSHLGFHDSPGVDLSYDQLCGALRENNFLIFFGVLLAKSKTKIDLVFCFDLQENSKYIEIKSDIIFDMEVVDSALQKEDLLNEDIKNIFFKVEDDLQYKLLSLPVQKQKNNVNGANVMYYLDSIDNWLNGERNWIEPVRFKVDSIFYMYPLRRRLYWAGDDSPRAPQAKYKCMYLTPQTVKNMQALQLGPMKGFTEFEELFDVKLGTTATETSEEGPINKLIVHKVGPTEFELRMPEGMQRVSTIKLIQLVEKYTYTKYTQRVIGLSDSHLGQVQIECNIRTLNKEEEDYFLAGLYEQDNLIGMAQYLEGYRPIDMPELPTMLEYKTNHTYIRCSGLNGYLGIGAHHSDIEFIKIKDNITKLVNSITSRPWVSIRRI